MASAASPSGGRKVLIVDDDRSICEFMVDGLSRRGFAADFCLDGEEASARIGGEDVDVLVADINMPGLGGMALCRRIAATRPDIPVVVITAFGSLDTAITAIRAGAYDFVTKPFEIEELVLAIERAAQHRELREEVKRLRLAVEEAHGIPEIIGESRPIRDLCRRIGSVARSEATVLVTGETGTGKDLVARALHARSGRREGPFVAINCAALAESLLESELFGHVKGAFTDAREARKGLLVRASHGTVFLDEIGDMPAAMQPKLLRAIETRTVRPVGSDSEVPFDARIVAATNRDLDSDVEEGRFRKDLYFRVNVIRLEIPPLRARGNDILLLAQHFLTEAAARAGKAVTGLSPGAAERLLAFPWPGNVRELQNAVEHGIAVTSHESILADDLPERVRDYRQSHVLVAAENPSELLPMHEVERRYILRVLDAVGGNKTLAARVLGFDRRTMYRKLERFETRRGV